MTIIINTKQLEDIIEIVKNISIKKHQYWVDTYLEQQTKKEIAEYFNLPDLFTCNTEKSSLQN